MAVVWRQAISGKSGLCYRAAMDDKVEQWFASLTDEQRSVADILRKLVVSRGRDLREELKWNQPCYWGNSMVCYIQSASKHVSLGFGQGARLPDPDGNLVGQGAHMRHITIPVTSNVDETLLGELIDEAIALDRR